MSIVKRVVIIDVSDGSSLLMLCGVGHGVGRIVAVVNRGIHHGCGSCFFLGDVVCNYILEDFVIVIVCVVVVVCDGKKRG